MINNWNCPVCKIYNDILTNNCISCQHDKPDWLTFELQCIAEIKRGIFLARITAPHWGLLDSHSISELLDSNTEDTERNDHEVTPQEELFAKFYNQEKILVRDMDIAKLREHRDELAVIAFEAKARLGAVDDEARERNKKSPNKEWLVTTDTSDLSKDAINAPKIRAKRMSKLDQLRTQLLAANIDEETVNQMIRDLEKKATESNVNAITFKPVKSSVNSNVPSEFKTPVQERITEAKEQGVITDSDNPFAKLF